MYVSKFNASAVASEIVDGVRAETVAPLSSCIRAAKHSIATLLHHLQEDGRVKELFACLDNFTVDEDNCWDSRQLAALGDALGQICDQKEEQLTNSVTDCDGEMEEVMNLYVKIARTTESGVAEKSIEKSLTEFSRLVSIFQSEQKGNVGTVIIEFLTSLCPLSRRLIHCLLETQLPIALCCRVRSCREELSHLQKACLALLAHLLSLQIPPPLSQLSTFNGEFCSLLWRLASEGSEEAMSTLLGLHECTGGEAEVVSSLCQNPPSNIGEKLIHLLNQRPTAARLGILRDVLNTGEELTSSLFYTNDLQVLSHVAGRHLLNEQCPLLRTLSLEVIVALLRQRIKTEDARDAVLNCSIQSPLKDEAELLLS